MNLPVFNDYGQIDFHLVLFYYTVPIYVNSKLSMH